MRLGLAVLCAVLVAACGTALYHNAITVSTIGPADTRVGVFDHQQGYSRDWAHQALEPTSASAPYSTTITTTAAASIGTVRDAHPFDIALAIPELTDEGYFMLTINGASDASEVRAKFCRYGEYTPEAGAPDIPVLVTSSASDGNWNVALTVDFAKAMQAFRRQ